MKYWQETLAVTQRILIELIRRRRSLFFWAIFPIAILLLNGYILAERANLATAEAMKTAAPATLVGAALFFSCLGGSVSTVVSEREQKTIKRLFIAPLSGFSYFFGIFLAHSCIGFGQLILVYLLVFFWGAELNGDLFLGLGIVFLSIMSYVGVGFVLGAQLARRTEDVNALVATFGVPLLILGGAFLPTSLFPQTLLDIAQFNPIFHISEALTGVWVNGETLGDISDHLRFLIIFAIAAIACGWLSYHQMLKTERQL
ncbi:MAG: ABC transporter permease [Jaaginema sp. PMC 1079.18]|nr:ABC transporter permease [Jaaginema sp. PMC 1080.18]MEC4853139.1 ABC transporter permease [Jaaginema sp. PMC 1079.18]MEC4864981.1 ABC transporter permease [Jaaginema sp. PMC 1078.18]